MGADRIEGRDIDNDGFTAWRGKLCDEPGAVVTFRIDTASQVLHLKAEEAARVGRFLLEAAGVDLVGATRKVAEVARQEGKGDAGIHDVRVAIHELAAELDKLEGGAR